MRVPDVHRRGGVDFNMTPMIDVVFLLIIFFLVSSHLARQEAQMVLPLPEADSGQRSPADDAPRVTINVLRDGSLMWAGRTVPVERLSDRLREKLARDGEDLEVRIRADRNVAYLHVEPILLACARAGIWNVTFASYRPEESPQ
jgi:biopolymer transport protein ExbD